MDRERKEKGNQIAKGLQNQVVDRSGKDTKPRPGSLVG